MDDKSVKWRVLLGLIPTLWNMSFNRPNDFVETSILPSVNPLWFILNACQIIMSF